MAGERGARLRRIGWQLPLSTALLLLAVVALFSWTAYREVRRAARDAAGERLRDVAQQLASLLEQSVQQRVAETARVAADSAVVARLASPGDEVLAPVQRSQDRLLASSEQVLAVELRDVAGRRVAVAARPSALALPVPHGFPRWEGGDTAAVSGFQARGDTVWYAVAVAVGADGRRVGDVVQSRRLGSSSQGAQLVADLIGNDAAFFIGGPDGVWTDLARVVPRPAAVAPEQVVEYESAKGVARLGVGADVTGTPWRVWVEFPTSVVLARPRVFLGRMAPVGLVIVLLGAAGGWALSRRVTARLGHLTAAANAMADGEYSQRLSVEWDDELGDLAAAFDTMARHVDDAQHRLERQVAERTAQLRSSEEQFRTLAATANDAIVTADRRGCITYFNPGAERMFGYSTGEACGKPLTLLMPERFHQPHASGFARYLETGEARVVGRTVELTGRRKDGTEFPVELSLASWHRGDEPAFAGIIRDITARRESEEAMRRYAVELEAANKELEAFSYSVSHDLRAPLRSIHGFSQAVLEDHGDRLDAEGADFLRRACAASERMGALIDGLLELSRVTRSELHRERVDLSGLAARVASDLRKRAPERVVEFHFTPGLVAEGDPRLLAVVLENLLQNAWKFTTRRTRARVEFGATRDGDRPVYYVRDNGAGFDMAYADQLFGAFRRLHNRVEFPGTGIGLATVQRIVHRHGGRIWAEGAVDDGATFYFTV